MSTTQKSTTDRERKSETRKRWLEYKERNNSFIDHLFTGLYRSTVTCERCSLCSVTYDPFMVISLPVVAPSLAGCLDHFFTEERLSSYFCHGCKQDSQSATLRVGIAKHPELLVIHFKRF